MTATQEHRTVKWSVRCRYRNGMLINDIPCGTEREARAMCNPVEARRILAMPVATTQLIRTTHTEEVIA